MKRILSILLMFCLLGAGAMTAAELSKKEVKRLEKECKNKTKDLKKQGWTILGSTRTLDGAIKAHYDKMVELGDDGHEYVGIATSVKSKNNGKQMAATNAATSYASDCESELRMRIVGENSIQDGAEFENFYQAYEREVNKSIKGEMKESFSIIRDNGNGTYEVQTFYIVSENSASKARLAAMNNALNESEAARKHAEKISEFVRGGK